MANGGCVRAMSGIYRCPWAEGFILKTALETALKTAPKDDGCYDRDGFFPVFYIG
jgi:hypothetical protein